MRLPRDMWGRKQGMVAWDEQRQTITYRMDNQPCLTV